VRLSTGGEREGSKDRRVKRERRRRGNLLVALHGFNETVGSEDDGTRESRKIEFLVLPGTSVISG
jgi:hypothetical protein